MVRCLAGTLDSISWQTPASSQENFEVLSGGKPRFGQADSTTLQVEIAFVPPLKPGEERLVVTKSTYDGTEKEVNFRRYSPGTRQVGHVTLAVEFAEDSPPTRVWWFQDLRKMDTPTRYDPAHAIPVARHVERQFDNPAHDRHSGLAWDW